ncbi:bifunctional 4-hydroxy-2-oxoglutarate aldolase/2-dehydro-3-deoxy-phosphogluconate aldolase [Cellvibrio fibrivorans]|uniref:2-dehydro-3-deoxyphosphogluconate aldolase/(4S)-4-hydroxy-2-oxoglutarate aldolase n=1 Tax=Cellvibrio fibrivorans TaxID=126350 RepID=A0ABU1UVW2_9GAMM|nr:bifunctional 4-hydroxy-2-oxoglutarate aldolase/2-dehydro-3-deoxy-phosphogluconate aldolase [Cellvibrio fibrivorans]MDR7089272.1 2-dehydro-3-deoxyphosphogluconate aldolase/(4S)-4-hydroxy-2-oxoglutarate aldolase [Cellvibrio fibrivorans]
MKFERVNKLLAEKLIVILRVKHSEDIIPIVQCLAAAGIKALEVTANTPNFCAAISRIRSEFPEVLVGAGTITNVLLAQQAMAAGAQFLVTPNTSSAVVKVAHEQEVPVVMGAFTPTEIVAAIEAQADIVKLFPAEPMGPDYLKSLAFGPFNDTIFFPVGGINELNIERWANSGAKGIGVGGSLAAPVRTPEEAQRLVERLKTLIEKVATLF